MPKKSLGTGDYITRPRATVLPCVRHHRRFVQCTHPGESGELMITDCFFNGLMVVEKMG